VSGAVEAVDTVDATELDATELDAIGLDVRDRPLVIRGGARDQPAVSRWTPAYLADRIGDVELAFKHSPTGEHPNFRAASLAEMFARERMTFREFLARAATSPSWLFTGDEEFLVRRRDGITTANDKLAPLLADVAPPAAVPTERLYTVWAWFSGAGVHTWLHYDNNGCHNLNAQLAGEKSCVLFAPEHVDRLEPFPLGGANPATNCSRLPREAIPGDVPRIHATLRAGDLLFIPAWWLHAFDHAGAFNANVNWWWKPARPIGCAPARRH
jgi:hypothetical protein